jgi:hypothetical protein
VPAWLRPPPAGSRQFGYLRDLIDPIRNTLDDGNAMPLRLKIEATG